MKLQIISVMLLSTISKSFSVKENIVRKPVCFNFEACIVPTGHYECRKAHSPSHWTEFQNISDYPLGEYGHGHMLEVTGTSTCLAIWCYQCTTATPGCADFNWRGMGYLGNPCPDSEDICVKLIERKGAREVITRDCLSNFRAFRTDVPADTYEGCRPAAKDVNLANYVNNTIKELDVKRNWYDETVWCFCFLDHRCNSASSLTTSMALLMLSTGMILFKLPLF